MRGRIRLYCLILGISVSPFFLGCGGCGNEDPEPVPKPVSKPKPKPVSDLDPDGDLISASDDRRPWIADIPSLDFSVVDLELGIDVETESTGIQKEIAVRSRDFRETNQDTQTNSEESVRVQQLMVKRMGGSGGVNIGASVIPITYSGCHTESSSSMTKTSVSRHVVRRDRLTELSTALQAAQEKKDQVRISSNAGYLQLVLNVLNRSATPCHLEDFTTHMRVNGRLAKSFLASDAGFHSRKLPGRTVSGEEILLKLTGINTAEIMKLIQDESGLDLSIDVPASGIRADYVQKLESVREKCARVEVHDHGRNEVFYVSAVDNSKDSSKDSISLEQLIRRIPEGEDAKWSVGPKGDFLAKYLGKDGCGFMLPDVGNEGNWYLFDDSGELVGDVRGKQVIAGSQLKIQYVRSSDYWGARNEWEGYVNAYRDLRFLKQREYEFWSFLDGLNNGDSADKWNARTQELVRDQAEKLATNYREYFEDVPPAIERFYPSASAKVAEFERWFCNDEVRFPTYEFSVTGAKIQWNVDFDESDSPAPFFEITCGNSKVVGEVFVPDDDGKSGTIRVEEEEIATLVWTPLDTIRLRVGSSKYLGLQEEDWLHIQFATTAGILDLFNKHALDRMPSADPELSQVRITFGDEVRHIQTGAKSAKADFRNDLFGTRPRVIHLVPSELTPAETIAADLFLAHDPRCYRWSAMVHKDLYDSDADLNNLAYAATAFFRSFSFNKASEIVTAIGVVGDAQELANLPDGMGYEELKVLSAVADKTKSLERNSPPYNALMRCILHLHAFKRLEYVARKPTVRDSTLQEIKNWRGNLLSDIADERCRQDSQGDPVITTFIERQLEDIEKELKSLEVVK